MKTNPKAWQVYKVRLWTWLTTIWILTAVDVAIVSWVNGNSHGIVGQSEPVGEILSLGDGLVAR
ncbi:MAG TPA: hypothetical protein VEC99_13540 [Clostridia bacterium]|nr:hypothetical protein [Clostridia bacterium]